MRKKINILYFLFLFIGSSYAQEKCVRGAHPYGFFANFLWAINHLEYCLSSKKTPVIYWDHHFPYYSPQGYNGSYNGWEYYFEPVSHASYAREDYIHTNFFYKKDNNFSTLWWYPQYIKNKFLLSEQEQKNFHALRNHEKEYLKINALSGKNNYPVSNYHLYDNYFRKFVYDTLIVPFIKIKNPIKKEIDQFYLKNMNGKKTIGIHLRGNHKDNEVFAVPIFHLLQEANKHAHNNVQFFIATDQLPLLKKAQNKLKGDVIYYPCQRFSQTTAPYPGVKLNPKLGENLLIETLLLSKCDHLIHTISNVSTAALYFNPALKHTLIY